MTKLRSVLLVVAPLVWLAGVGCGSSSSSNPDRTKPGAAGQNSASGPEADAGSDSDSGADDDAGGSAPTGGSTSRAGSTGNVNVSGSSAAGRPPRGDDGDGGETTSAGGAGATPARGSATLGSTCDSTADCKSGLTCLSADSGALAGQSPPHGLCTSPCAADDECTPYGSSAICFPFTNDATGGYCIEGCSFGQPGLAKKCHNREDFACMPALLGDTGDACTDASDCFSGELCDGHCYVVIPGCLPSCRGDLDCPSDSYCDQSFLNGICTKTKPSGLPLGAPCTPAAAGEPDECLGFCQLDSAEASTGHCATTCGLGNGCAWNSEQQQFDGACLYVTALDQDVASAGDFGFCAPSCNCNAECQSDAFECNQLPAGAVPEPSKGPGACFDKAAGSTTIDDCQP